MAEKKEEKKKVSLASLNTTLTKKYGRIMPDPKEAGTIRRLVLSDPGLNRVYGGGYPLGRVSEFYGPPSGGKTVLANYIGSDFQKRKNGPPFVLFVDMEHTFDERYARNVGLEIENPLLFKLIRPLYGEQAFDICQQYVETGEVGLIIWDSVAATPSAAQSLDEYGKASFGGAAKLFSEGLRKFNPYLSHYGTSLHLVNQVRDKIGGMTMPGMPKPESQPGGQAIKFYASWRARVSQSDPIMMGSQQVGNKIYIKNQKSKVGVPKRSTTMELLYASGFNPDPSYRDFIIDLGIVEARGSWYSNSDWGLASPGVNGKDKLYEYLVSHPDVFEEAKKQVNESFLSFSSMDLEDTIPDALTEIEADATPGAGME